MNSNISSLVTKALHMPPPLIGIPLDGFLSMDIPPMEFILEPWLGTRSLNMLHAKRGVGKSHVGLAIAYAVATGTTFLNWNAPKARKVVYLDGEMSAATVQARLQAIASANACDTDLHKNLVIFTPDLHYGLMPDISNRTWHYAIKDLVRDTELVIVDNLSCLARSGGNENDADSWDVVAEWAMDMRRNGVAVLFMHHSGKSGQQRGTSRKEDILNVVLNLKHPADYTADMGAFFEVHFEKGRELFGDNTKAFLAKLVSSDGVHRWEITDLEKSVFDQTVKMWQMGMSVPEIAMELDVNKSTIYRCLKRAKDEGLIKKTQ
jgi:hypothetical protein